MQDRLHTVLEPTVTGLGYELLGIERGRGPDAQLVRLYIDHVDGISVDDCETVSRQVGDVIEVENAIRGAYTLEVSSPGVERPLFTLEQHRPFIGNKIQVRLRSMVNGRRRLSGVLNDVGAEELVVDVDGEAFNVPFLEVERSRLVAEWS